MYVLNAARAGRIQLESVAQAPGDIKSNNSQDFSKENIVLIEPRHLLRECLARGLESASDFMVSSYASVEEWAASGATQSAAVLMLSAGGRARREVLADFDALTKAGNRLPIVLLAQQESIDCILEMLGKGARAYVPMSLPVGVAIEAIRLVKAGGTFVPASSLVAAQAPLEPEPFAFHVGDAVFTHRQAAVLEALRCGKANKIIAYELSMQESTVKVHVRNIMRKLNAKNRTEVAVLINASRNDRAQGGALGWSHDANVV